MSNEQLKELVSAHIEHYRVGDEIRIPSGKFWSAIDAAWLAATAEAKSRLPNQRELEFAR